MPTTPWEARKAGFVLMRDHHLAPEGESDYHAWVWLPAYHGDPVYLTRDWLGRSTTSPAYYWAVMMCNNSDCPARALVRADSHLSRPLEMWLPVPPRRD